jgi:alanine racemase
MQSTSIIELSQSALANNVRFLQQQYGESVIICSIVKANAYGHGIDEMVPMIEECGIKHFGVFSADEAMRVKKALNGDKVIMIMGYIADKDYEWVVRNNIEFYISDSEKARKMIKVTEKLNKKAVVHIDLETGMNRTGLNQHDLKKTIAILKKHKDQFYIKGVCTHFAGAESIANYVRIQNQIKHYHELVEYLKGEGIDPELKHTACSAAAMTYPETRMDMVRIGIMQYGFWPSKETFIHYINTKTSKKDPLRRVLRWKSKVMDVKKVKRGEFIGYGNFYQAYSDMKIAIVPVGYYDGYSRSLSNQGKVLINDQRIGIIGMVNMNLLVANVTNLPDVKIGDEVVIIGKQGKYQLTVASFSELSKQVNYELLTRLPLDIIRIKTK